jgi:cobalt-zinc-cadmium efflux system outer membrane protein
MRYRAPLANAITHPVIAGRALAAMVLGIGIAGCAHYSPKPLVPQHTAVALESRSLSDPGLRAFIERSLGHALADWPLKSWNLERLTLVAFYYSPELDVARAQWGVAQAAVVTAGTRPNPTLNVTPEYATHVSPGVSPWLPSIALDMPIETAGKRGRRVTQAQQLSESVRWSVVTTAWDVRRRLTGALLEHTVARNRERLLRRQLDLQEEIVQLEQGELTAGAVATSDVTVARIQLAKIRLDLQATRAQVAETRSRSAAALGTPLRALDGANLSFEFDFSEAPALTSEEARRRALQGRSDVMGALAEYEATQTALQLEIAKQYPDIHLGPGYQYDQGQNDWLIGLTVELPVFNRNEGPIAEAAARRTEAAGRFVALQATIIHEIDAAISALKAADEASLAADELLTAQRQSLQAVEVQVAAGALGAFDLASARIDAANAETLAFEASVRRQQAVRALEDAVQRPLGAEADAQATVLQIEATQRSPHEARR